MTPTTPDPARAAAREVRRALLGLAAGPLRLAGYALERDAIRAGVERDLSAPAPPLDEPDPAVPTDRPLRLFVSCGEASSQVHAERVVRSVAARLAEAGAPPATWVGLGGRELEEAGVACAADPTARATMGAQGVSHQVGFWRGVLTAAGEALAGCDAALLVDAPALHVPVARLARDLSVPSVHLVTPQYWGWAPWRVRAYARAVTRPLCILPFEAAWFARHGVDARYVGHPQADLLAERPAPPPPEDPGRRDLVLLPGSRRGEIEAVLPVLVEAVSAAGLDDAPVRVLQRTDEHAALVRAIAGEGTELVIGDPHEALDHARAALATSGTVLIDLLHHRLPTVVFYALRGALRTYLSRWLVTVPHFASPNLLAREEVLPEVAFPAASPPAPAALGPLVARCYNDAAWRAGVRRGLDRAARRLGPPGAARRAALHLLDVAAPAFPCPPIPPTAATRKA